MECVALDVERHHLGIADFDTLFVGDGVERAFDLQAGLGGRRGNQLDHGHAIDDGAPAPDLRDVAEQAMLDLIPLRGARRIMMDMEPEAGLVGELLQLDLPQPDTRSIRAAAIGRDRQFAWLSGSARAPSRRASGGWRRRRTEPCRS
jgi:hypothetical protein